MIDSNWSRYLWIDANYLKESSVNTEKKEENDASHLVWIR